MQQLRNIVAVLLYGAVCVALAGCSQDTTHTVVGSWGAPTQSGEVPVSIVFAPDGTYTIATSSGISFEGERTGCYRVVDEATVRADSTFGPDGAALLMRADQDSMTVISAGNDIRGFVRIEY